MSEQQTETVDIDSLVKAGASWELRVYQTPAVLRVNAAELASRLEDALAAERPVILCWEPETGLVCSVD